MSGKTWYFSKEGRRCGPFSPEQMAGLAKRGQVVDADLVWHEGIDTWTPLRELRGELGLPEDTPPSPPASTPQPTPLAGNDVLDSVNTDEFGGAQALKGGDPVGVGAMKLAVDFDFTDSVADRYKYPEVGETGANSDDLEEDGYAGFWRRAAAWLVDYGVVMVIWLALSPLLSAATGRLLDAAAIALTILINQLIALAYYAIMESGPYQGTLGKLLLGLRVACPGRERMTVGKALARNAAKYVSVLTFGVGYAMAGITAKKQALHDLMTGCLVVRKGED